MRVACIQMACTLDQGENLKTCQRLMRVAGEGGADLVVFPEFSNYPSYFESVDQVYSSSTPVPGPFTQALGELARRYHSIVVVNVMERQTHPDVYDASAVIDEQGEIIAKYHKHLLHRHEHVWIRAGLEPIQVVATSVGRIGLYTCADGLIPDITRCLALQGAEMIVNTMNSFAPDESLLHVMMRGIENRVWSILANKVGKFPGTVARSYIGGSEVVSPTGDVLVRASWDDEEVIFADITPNASHDKSFGEGNDLFADRRPDTYGLLVRPNIHVPAVNRRTQGTHGLRAQYRVAALQVGPVTERVESWSEVVPVAEKAFLAGASIIVLPELFAWRRDAIAADPAAAARHSQRLIAEAREYCVLRGLYAALGLVTEENGRYYNAAVLIGDDRSVIGEYRQVHLLASERRWATAGDRYVVLPTCHGNLGLLIGYDLLFPEAPRVVAAQAADLILNPSAWLDRHHPELYSIERAAENHVSLTVAARPDSPFQAGSAVIPIERFPTDRIWTSRCPLPAVAPLGNHQFAIATVDPGNSLDKRCADHTELFACRTPELYGAMADRRLEWRRAETEKSSRPSTAAVR